ncbi:MAG: hypothetical protein NTW96_17125 [Planctomycetia bacterium]|nr:hypothetical protein [Planctomycetia bacterium]
MFRASVVALMCLAAATVTFSDLWPCSAAAPTGLSSSTPPGGFRGVFFNPSIRHANFSDYPWPTFDPYGPEYRGKIRAALHEIADDAKLNFIDVFIPIPFTLARPPQAPRAGQPLHEWANIAYLDNAAAFVDDCHDAGIFVEFDLADNRWIPYCVDSQHHLGRPGGNCWPVADDTPWDESATWFSEVIDYIESHAKHPENIAMWGMMGHYQLGTAEPDLWGNDLNPAVSRYTEKFVKNVWPAFRAAGKRPKASPIMLPIFSNNSYWMAKTPESRLAAFSNLKKWLVDDLALPPDYWPMTTYCYCDPAPDGVYYLRRIVEILGKENASRIISTDFKGPGHDQEIKDSIISAAAHSPSDMLTWHFQKCAEYGFAGWWIYAYQDQEVFDQRSGIRCLDGRWKNDLLRAIKQQTR